VGEVDPLRFLEDEFNLSFVVERRLGVGHAADGGEPAGDSGLRAGLDGFLFLVAGFAEVDVDVDQTGGDVATGGVDDFVRTDGTGASASGYYVLCPKPASWKQFHLCGDAWAD
ncbi:MAG TPA: hypothetical protein VLI90_12445, partial [Tepidisphaeraceae bacterium]|nr:hypothetical protein [Tepidisphaeraceae bacterium]